MRAAARLGPLLGVVGLLLSPAARADAGPASEGNTLTVFAAASLREAFGGLGEAFQRSHPGAVVRFNFAGSQELRTQIEHGAPADVFASADTRHMDALRREGLVEAPRLFATNAPVIVVPADDPARVRGLADLPGVRRLVIGAPEVPVGAYALQILDRARATLGADFPARVQARVASRELNVRQVLTKVVLGEADAGIVYRTDARSAGARVGVREIPPGVNVVAEYPIAAVAHGRHPDLTRAWIALVTGPEGRAALASAGFGIPAGS